MEELWLGLFLHGEEVIFSFAVSLSVVYLFICGTYGLVNLLSAKGTKLVSVLV